MGGQDWCFLCATGNCMVYILFEGLENVTLVQLVNILMTARFCVQMRLVRVLAPLLQPLRVPLEATRIQACPTHRCNSNRLSLEAFSTRIAILECCCGR